MYLYSGTMINVAGWWFGTCLILFPILGIWSCQLTNSYFSEEWLNYQPVWYFNSLMCQVRQITTSHRRFFFAEMIYTEDYANFPQLKSEGGFCHLSSLSSQATVWMILQILLLSVLLVAFMFLVYSQCCRLKQLSDTGAGVSARLLKLIWYLKMVDSQQSESEIINNHKSSTFGKVSVDLLVLITFLRVIPTMANI